MRQGEGGAFGVSPVSHSLIRLMAEGVLKPPALHFPSPPTRSTDNPASGLTDQGQDRRLNHVPFELLEVKHLNVPLLGY